MLIKLQLKRLQIAAIVVIFLHQKYSSFFFFALFTIVNIHNCNKITRFRQSIPRKTSTVNSILEIFINIWKEKITKVTYLIK